MELTNHIDSTELLVAMKQMLQAQNWHAYLQFRRAYLKAGGETSQVRRQLSSLPDAIQLAYGRFFNSSQELAKRAKSQLKKEAALKIAAKQAERKTAQELRLQEQVKPRKRPVY